MQFLLSRPTDAHNLGGFAVRNVLNLLLSQSDHYIRVSAFKKASRVGVAPFSIRYGREPMRSWHAIARWYWTGHSFPKHSTKPFHFFSMAASIKPVCFFITKESKATRSWCVLGDVKLINNTERQHQQIIHSSIPPALGQITGLHTVTACRYTLHHCGVSFPDTL